MGYDQRKRVARSLKKRRCSDGSRHQTCSRLRHGSCRGCLKGEVSARGRTWTKEVCAVGAKTCCHRTWLVFTRPSSNDSKHLVPTAISERTGIGRRPRDVHYTIDSPFTAPFSSTQRNKHPKEENQEERPIGTGAKTGEHYKFLFPTPARRTSALTWTT